MYRTLYKIRAIILTNIVKLDLPTIINIYPIVNISRIVIYIRSRQIKAEITTFNGD